jgi:hypothetical protein
MVYIIIILVAIAFFTKHNSSKVIGEIGERRVRNELDRLDLKECKILNDIMLMTSKGTSQIDHIVISPYGIFVIETKNYNGWIHGSDNSEYWTKTVYRRKYQFHNPIKQNWSHIYALKEVLSDYKSIPYYPIVIFAGSAILKNVNTKYDVIYPENLYNTILGHSGIQQLNNIDVENIYTKLKSLSINSISSTKKHVENIERKIIDKNNLINNHICPKCGNKLALRNGPYNQFYGCSNYPKCKYKASINM